MRRYTRRGALRFAGAAEGPTRVGAPRDQSGDRGQLFLSVEAVKSHVRVLFGKCGLESVPQSEKRVRLVEHALRTGLVADHEL